MDDLYPDRILKSSGAKSNSKGSSFAEERDGSILGRRIARLGEVKNKGDVGGIFTGEGASLRSRAEDGEDVGSFARDIEGGVGAVRGRGDIVRGGSEAV
jgi:hypothetical protein